MEADGNGVAIAAKTATVLLVDDHPLFRDGIRQLLSQEPQFKVCGEAGSVAEARRIAAALRPEVILLDVMLPDGDGLDMLEETREWLNPPKVLVLSMKEEDDESAMEAMRMGAAGFVCKRVPGKDLLEVLRRVMTGQSYLSPSLVERLVRRRGGG